MLQVRTQTADRQYLHVSPEKVLYLLLESDHIEQRSTGLDVDEEIDIAVLTIVAARRRTEYSHVARSMTCRDLQDPAPVLTERFEPHVRMIAVAISAERVCREAGHSVVRGGGGMCPRSVSTVRFQA
jgi:hypothetical protein